MNNPGVFIDPAARQRPVEPLDQSDSTHRSDPPLATSPDAAPLGQRRPNHLQLHRPQDAAPRPHPADPVRHVRPLPEQLPQHVQRLAESESGLRQGDQVGHGNAPSGRCGHDARTASRLAMLVPAVTRPPPSRP